MTVILSIQDPLFSEEAFKFVSCRQFCLTLYVCYKHKAHNTPHSLFLWAPEDTAHNETLHLLLVVVVVFVQVAVVLFSWCVMAFCGCCYQAIILRFVYLSGLACADI